MFVVHDSSLGETDLFFTRYATILSASDIPAPDVPDPDDAFIVAAAPSADAGLFVTDDKTLLALEAIETMQIVRPRTVFMRLRGLD